MKKHKDLVVTIQMNGRKSARKRRISLLPRIEITKPSPERSVNVQSQNRSFQNVSPRIDNKGPKSPARTPRIIEGKS